MKCTEFIKGIAVGMIAGGSVVFLVTMPHKKHRCGVAGRVLKCAGHVVESLSDALGM